MSCPWALDDGAYLLGALSPDDRRGYEEHISDCAACAAALREVAGLPGLLSRLPAESIEAPAPPPATLLPALLAAAQAQRFRARRRVRLSVAGAAVAAAAVGAAVLVVPRLGGSVAPPPVPATSLARMVDAPISASVVLVDKAWGTEVDLKCTYSGPSSLAPATYLLVATDRSGRDQQIATWRVISGRPVTVIAATALRSSELSTIEVRSPAGRPVLRLQR